MRPLMVFVLLCGGPAIAGTVTYLANEAVLVESGSTRILFDPLFDEGFDRYELLPAAMRESLMAGTPPFDDIDAVFVSHRHGDHFSAAGILDYLRRNRSVRLYAPAQAVAAMRAEAGSDDVFARVTGIAMENGDAPVAMTVGDVDILVDRVPHSGWPDRMADVENLVFRVTLDDQATVAHFGDADADPAHFGAGDTWSDRPTDLAMPPYWFFLAPGGRRILDDVVRPRHAIGIHVPTSMPDEPAARPPELQGFDLFTEPGQQRDIP